MLNYQDKDMSHDIVLTRLEDVISWSRANSQWYLLFGLACCAIELMQTGGPRADIDRFGFHGRRVCYRKLHMPDPECAPGGRTLRSVCL